MHRHTEKIDSRAGGWAGKQTAKQTDAGKQANKAASRQTDRQTYMYITQISGQTEKHKQTQISSRQGIYKLLHPFIFSKNVRLNKVECRTVFKGSLIKTLTNTFSNIFLSAYPKS